ncbi:MAG: hypothetical protein IJR61_00040, partial [Clostridia bacterium]|nr:hypothetical protein [Clostridia bacterium]
MKIKKLLLAAFSAVFAFALAMSLISVSGSRAQADEIIDSVSITVNAPEAGKTVGDINALPQFANEDLYWTSGEYALWIDNTADKDMTAADTFIGGHEYTCQLQLFAKNYPSNKFLLSGLGNPDVNVRVNGMVGYATKAYNIYFNQPEYCIWVKCDFPALPEVAIDTVRVTDVTEPKSGANPSFNVTPFVGMAELNTFMGTADSGVYWYDYSTGSGLTADKTFEKGKTYELQIYLKAQEGYYFKNLKTYIDYEQTECDYNENYITMRKKFVCEDTKITNVYVRDLDAPVATNTPDYLIECNDDHYDYEVKWFDDSSNLLTSSSVFENGEEYHVEIVLKAHENYGFAMDGSLLKVTAALNGDPVVPDPDLISDESVWDKTIYIRYNFAPCGGGAVKNIFINGLVEPKHGAVAEQSEKTLAESAAYKVTGIAWTDEIGTMLSGTYANYFEYGKTYYAKMMILANDGFTFDSDCKVYVNGRQLIGGEIQAYDSDNYEVKVGYTCAAKIINRVDVTITEPVHGEHPTGDGEVGDEKAYNLSGLLWYPDADYEEGYPLDNNHTFTDNYGSAGIYGAWIYLETNSGYEFAVDEHGDPAVDVYVNGIWTIGLKCEGNENAKESMDVKMSFYCEPVYTVTFDLAGRAENITVRYAEETVVQDVVSDYADKGQTSLNGEYIVGFSFGEINYNDDPSAIYGSLIGADDYYTAVNSDTVLYAYWVSLPDPLYKVATPAGGNVNADGEVHELGKFTFTDYPVPSIFEEGNYSFAVNFASAGLVNKADPENVVPVEIYIYREENTCFTLGENIVATYNNTEKYDFISLAGSHGYVYIDGYGTEEEFAAVDVAGKIAICNRGNIS